MPLNPTLYTDPIAYDAGSMVFFLLELKKLFKTQIKCFSKMAS
jgi:hypothetical protein